VAHMDQSRRATALSPASLSPRQCVAPLSPPSRPDARANAGESEAISPAVAGRECRRPLSPSRLPIASRGAVEGPSRLPSSPIGTSLRLSPVHEAFNFACSCCSSAARDMGGQAGQLRHVGPVLSFGQADSFSSLACGLNVLRMLS
jgi:hypothetical protein